VAKEFLLGLRGDLPSEIAEMKTNMKSCGKIYSSEMEYKLPEDSSVTSKKGI
jgi:hypothetical protein